MITFKEWLKIKESSPLTRSRNAAILGTGPKLPDATMLGGRSTNPYYGKKHKRKKKKK